MNNKPKKNLKNLPLDTISNITKYLYPNAALDFAIITASKSSEVDEILTYRFLKALKKIKSITTTGIKKDETHKKELIKLEKNDKEEAEKINQSIKSINKTIYDRYLKQIRVLNGIIDNISKSKENNIGISATDKKSMALKTSKCLNDIIKQQKEEANIYLKFCLGYFFHPTHIYDDFALPKHQQKQIKNSPPKYNPLLGISNYVADVDNNSTPNGQNDASKITEKLISIINGETDPSKSEKILNEALLIISNSSLFKNKIERTNFESAFPKPYKDIFLKISKEPFLNFSNQVYLLNKQYNKYFANSFFEGLIYYEYHTRRKNNLKYYIFQPIFSENSKNRSLVISVPKISFLHELKVYNHKLIDIGKISISKKLQKIKYEVDHLSKLIKFKKNFKNNDSIIDQFVIMSNNSSYMHNSYSSNSLTRDEMVMSQRKKIIFLINDLSNSINSINSLSNNDRSTLKNIVNAIKKDNENLGDHFAKNLTKSCYKLEHYFYSNPKVAPPNANQKLLSLYIKRERGKESIGMIERQLRNKISKINRTIKNKNPKLKLEVDQIKEELNKNKVNYNKLITINKKLDKIYENIKPKKLLKSHKKN